MPIAQQEMSQEGIGQETYNGRFYNEEGGEKLADYGFTQVIFRPLMKNGRMNPLSFCYDLSDIFASPRSREN